jgi:hypothetical protein
MTQDLPKQLDPHVVDIVDAILDVQNKGRDGNDLKNGVVFVSGGAHSS